MICDDVRNKLDVYVDSELSAEDLAEFESHLRTCPGCATAALGRLKMKHMTRAAGARFAPTPEFRLQIERSIRREGARSKPSAGLLSWKAKPAWRFPGLPGWAIACAVAVLLMASAVLWTGRGARERAYAELADLHVATLASPNPVDVVSTDRHTVKPWFAGRIPFSFDLPELQNTEFTLIGGRVAYFQRTPAAQLLFGLRQHKLSVFIFKEDAAGFPFAFANRSSGKLAFQSESWSQGGLRYVIISDAGAADVHALRQLLKNAARQ